MVKLFLSLGNMLVLFIHIQMDMGIACMVCILFCHSVGRNGVG